MLCQQCRKEFKEDELIKEDIYNGETGEYVQFCCCKECKDKFELDREKLEKEYQEFEHEREIKDKIWADTFNS